jgi:hypothetical protein
LCIFFGSADAMDPITEDLNKEMLSDIYNLKKKLK